MTWQSVWQQGRGKVTQFNRNSIQPNQPLQNPANATIWLVLWSQPIWFNRRLVRCFNYVTPLWSAVDYYQHLSVRRKAWNTPSLGTDWNQRFDQKQQWMSVTFMTWQSVWQYAAKKRKEMANWELTEERARRSCKWWWSDNLKNSWGLETVGGFFNGLMNEGKFRYRLRLDCSWDNSWSCTKTKSVKRWAYTLKFNKN